MDTGGQVRRIQSCLEIKVLSGAISNRNGAVLLLTLFFLLLLTILGTSSLYLGFSEMILTKSIESDARAFYIAESGIEQTLYWFSNPDKFSGPPEAFFGKRRNNNTAFFDENGISQYNGTAQSPDILISTDDYEIRVYGPTAPGTLCTVSSTGISGRIRRTVSVELFEDTSSVRVLRGTWRVD